jgi:hypothetical protein
VISPGNRTEQWARLVPPDLHPLPHGFRSTVVDVGVALFVALASDDESTRLGVVISQVQRNHLCPAQASGVEDPDEGGIPEVGWAATPARLKQCPQLPTGQCPAPRKPFPPDGGKVDGPLQVLGTHQPQPPSFSEDAPESGQVAIRCCWAVSLGQGGPQGLGVLVAQSVPGKLLDPDAAAR